MQSTKVFLSTYKLLSYSLKCQFYTQQQLQSRHPRLNKRSWNKQGPAIKGAKVSHIDNPEYLDNSDVGDEDDEIDIMKADIAYDEHYREEKKWRQKVGYKIAEQKFFASRQQPQMLTYNEKLCIKYLHEQDPVQWDIATLSESFPATPLVIQKVIKSKWKPTKEKIMKLNSAVQKNWELLEEGKLDADPEVIEHLKKFVNRREVLLEQIKNTKFYLPEIKYEKVFNSEMSSILQSYQDDIDKLTRSKCLETGPSLTRESSNSEGNETDAHGHLHKKVNKRAGKLGVEGKETFTLGRLDKSAMISQEKLLADILSKKESKERLDLGEGAILQYDNSKTHSKDLSNPSKSIDAELNDHASSSLDIEKPQNNQETEKSNRVVLSKKCNIQKVQRKFSLENDDTLNNATNVGSNTKLFTELEIGKHLKENKVIEIRKDEKSRKGGLEQYFNDNPERAMKDAEFLKKEVEDIQHTAFWDNKDSSQKKALRESQKQPLNADGKLGESAAYKYPERIKIPKKYIGSGFTFKVKDCYYDDDGQFLYRVPGMKS